MRTLLAAITLALVTMLFSAWFTARAVGTHLPAPGDRAGGRSTPGGVTPARASDASPPGRVPAISLAGLEPVEAEAATRDFITALLQGGEAAAMALWGGGPADAYPWQAAAQLQQAPPVHLRISALGSAAAGAVEQAEVWVWVDDRGPRLFRAVLALSEQGWRLRRLTGPIVPLGGFVSFGLTLLPERNAPPLAAPWQQQGQGLVLWSPRQPEPGLYATMEALRRAQAGQVMVVLGQDGLTADHQVAAAQAGGWRGEVWLVAGRLDALPVLARHTWLGADGVLVDRAGRVVAALGVLDAERFGDVTWPLRPEVSALLTALNLRAGPGSER